MMIPDETPQRYVDAWLAIKQIDRELAEVRDRRERALEAMQATRLICSIQMEN